MGEVAKQRAGISFGRNLRERDDLAAIPVILFTAESGELPDFACVVRKTEPDALLDMVDRAAS